MRLVPCRNSFLAALSSRRLLHFHAHSRARLRQPAKSHPPKYVMCDVVSRYDFCLVAA